MKSEHVLPNGQPVPGGPLPKPPLQRFLLEGCEAATEYEGEIVYVEGASAVEAAQMAELLYGRVCPHWRISQVLWLGGDAGDEVRVYTVLPDDPQDWSEEDMKRLFAPYDGPKNAVDQPMDTVK